MKKFEKLEKTKPDTIGSASRIEGVTPAAINIILVTPKLFLGINKKSGQKKHVYLGIRYSGGSQE